MDDNLKHYGVPGMKWGVRRAKRSLATIKDANKTGDKTVYKKPPSKLSDAELARRIKRLENEKKYLDLNKDSTAAGKDYVNKILKNSGSMVATTVATAGGIYVAKLLIGNIFGIETLQDMFPKKKK